MSELRNYIVLKYRDKHDITAGFDYVSQIEADRAEVAVDAAVRRENFRLGETSEQSGLYVAIAVSNFVPVESAVTQELSVKLEAKPLAQTARAPQ